MDSKSQQIWREALERLKALDAAWPDEPARQRALAECRAWIAEQTALPHLAKLARLLEPGLTRRQFWSALVPVEREVARLKVTDVEILDADLPAGAPAGELMLLTAVVDSVRSAFNVGGVFRTAECFGVRELVLCGYTPLPDQPQVAKAALGTERLVAWRYAEDIRAAITDLKASGVACVALETVAGAPDLAAYRWTFPCALVLGNERFGLDPEVVALCDAAVRIPLFGRKNSLNVVTAFAVAAAEVRRQFESGQGFQRPCISSEG
jgi:tRNA(Leu) C34 or U34 (ribose-2'-O)-methylase TrmL